MKENVVILGASDKKGRYSYQAMKMLEEYGHNPILVNPKLSNIEGRECFKELNDVLEKFDSIDTLTVYVRPEISNNLMEVLKDYPVKRVIFNPGTENDELEQVLRSSEKVVLHACTLVMLKTEQFG